MKKFVYGFSEGSKEMKNLLGGKGANLAEMTKIGLPVPPGFTISTEACINYYEMGEKLDKGLEDTIYSYLHNLEKEAGRKFGDREDPLLVSVRSGAVISMPGMMDTILNLGLNDETVRGLAEKTDNPRFAYDSYRRLLQMYGDVVLSIPKYKFDAVLEKVKKDKDIKYDYEIKAEDLKNIIIEYKNIIKETTGNDFPQKPEEQLMSAIKAVFDSWNNSRAISYRNANDIPHNLGTAVNIQTMVFGNIGNKSGTGVAFTRNPATGENILFGEFLLNAQGEDVVAGIRTPNSIEELEDLLPEVYKDFIKTINLLEKHYHDMQDIEFTIQEGELFLLQTRTGKRTAEAAVNIAVDMVEEGLIDKDTALLRIEADRIDQLLHPTFNEEELKKARLVATGLAASPGAAEGKVYFTTEDAVNASDKGEAVILVRTETSPEDIEGMVKAEGILTSRGGMTSHAAVVARGMGKCCVTGAGEIQVDERNHQFKAGEKVFNEGDYISLDGNTGNVYVGKIETTDAGVSDNFAVLMSWADEIRELGVWTNADTPKDAEQAVSFGAEGIGLCRTEHMFFDKDRIKYVREMIVANNKNERIKALDNLFKYQREDFKGIFSVMKERPVTIRLLDPPLHEFLPQEEKVINEVADDLELSTGELKNKIDELKEQNPMLGHRGCRLGITYPEIYEMQVRAIITAAVEVKKEENIDVKPDIMIPLVGFEEELKKMREVVCEVADSIIKESTIELNYRIGTMIEVPRATVIADKIANNADFFSFGTNDLTQMTLGFSRDDAGKFIGAYKSQEIIARDPFRSLDQEGVGALMKMAVKRGLEAKKDLKLGICGEHGGDPASIDFCHQIGLDYVSCSPFRVPVARLAAAQATINNK